MKTKQNLRSLMAAWSKFTSEVYDALFISSDKKEYQRLKDFIGS